MRYISSRLFTLCALLLLLSASVPAQNSSSSEVGQLFPKTVGDFRVQSSRPLASPLKLTPSDYDASQAAEGTYINAKGGRVTVTVIRTETQAGAYALLSEAAAEVRKAADAKATKEGEIGLAGVASPERIAFYKGRIFVHLAGKSTPGAENSLFEFARSFAQTLEEGESEIPFLVKHLPDWEKAQERAIYAVTLPALQRAAGRRPVLDILTFDKGTEAITAPYESSRLVIVEYTTPQIAESSDARITERIRQLRDGGQAVPSSYRRVGNYSVFVFDAPDESAAAQLIDSVKYEQKIQWLGENPLAWAAYQERHMQSAVSLILGIAKMVGFFLTLCLGMGGIVGGIFYLRRRAQRRATEAAGAYSDAGGMLRLNLDELSPETDPTKLLKAGDGKATVQ